MNGIGLHGLRTLLSWRLIFPRLHRTASSEAVTEKPKKQIQPTKSDAAEKVPRKTKQKAAAPIAPECALPKDIQEYFQSKDPSVLKLFPVSILRKNSQNTERFYVSDQTTAQQIADEITKDLPSDRLLIEVNPGPGLLTEQLLKRNVKKLQLYEFDGSFENQLLTKLNLPKDALRIADFNGLWRLSYLDGFDSGQRVLNLLKGIPSKKTWESDVSFRLFSVIGSVKFLRYLMNSITHQNEFHSLGRYEMILAMSPLTFSHIASTTSAGYKLYRGSTIVFQLYFEHELVGKVPRKHLLPWYPNSNSKKLRTKHQKLIQDGTEEWFLVRLAPRKDLFKHLLPDNLGLFASFVTQHYISRKNRIIPTLEHWVPNCGARLILNANYTPQASAATETGSLPMLLPKSMPLSSNDYVANMNIYTEFGELTPSQVLTLFNEFINWSDFHQSPFVQAVDSQKPKQPRLLRSMAEEEDVLDDPNEPSAVSSASNDRLKQLKDL